MDNTLHTIDTGALMRAEWIEKRDELISIAQNFTAVEDQQMLDCAGAIISNSAKHQKALKQTRLGITREIDALKRQIMDQEKDLVGSLDVEENRLRELSSAYLTEEARRRREIEADAEIKRRQAAEEALEKEQAARAAFGDGVAVAVPISEPTPEPVKARPTTAGTTTSWKFDIVDPALIPRCYLVQNDKAIRSAIRAMADQGLDPQIDGLRIWSEVNIRARG